MNFAKEQIDEQKEKLGETVSAAAITGRMAEHKEAQGKLFDVLLRRPEIDHSDLLEALGGNDCTRCA